jgi:hypothetical protein
MERAANAPRPLPNPPAATENTRKRAAGMAARTNASTPSAQPTITRAASDKCAKARRTAATVGAEGRRAPEKPSTNSFASKFLIICTINNR